MKKKLLYVLGVVAIAAVVCFNIYSAKSDVVLSDLALANVEALASGEGSSSDCDSYCKSDERYTCIIMYHGETEGVTCYNHRKR